MQINKLLILFSFLMFLMVSLSFAQVKDTVLKSTDSLKKQVDKPIEKVEAQPMSRQDSMKSKYINPGKVAGRKAVLRSLMIPGWGQLYNMQLLDDGYGERAGKNQTFQKIYTTGKIVAIYGGFTALTISYISSRNNYKRFLAEAQYRELNPGKKLDLSQYSNAGILTGKSTFKRNSQIVIFSYGLVYFANVVDAYVAARLHFFNIDDNLTFKILPSTINSNTIYGFNMSPALKLSLTF